MQITLAFVMGDNSLFWAIESQTFTLCTWTNLGDIIKTEHHIL